MKVVFLCAAAALLALAGARSTIPSKPITVPAHITSLTDKDNRRKAMEHEAFANAGRKAGVEVWRIEDFNPVPVPTSEYGKFYKGDSYIVLKTSANKRNDLSWDIHYWIGAASSQDEVGAAAILSVGLDDKFGGAAIQHRETQGYESNQFSEYFKPAIRHMDGGHASGFQHVTTNSGAEKRLFQVKGKRNVRVRQVDPLISSMNKGDCFILDVNQDILIYVGDGAKNVERLKAISVANQIRDQDHHGRGEVEIIDQYSSETDFQKFFTALGSGSRDTVPEDGAAGDDQTFEKSEESTVTLSEISDRTGSLKITPLAKPFTQAQLKPEECYILDTVTGSIYVWVGKQSTDREKTEAMNKAQQYLKAKNYPAWVHVSRIPQGTEPAAFKQYFQSWRDVGMTHSRIVRSADSDDDMTTCEQEPLLTEVILSPRSTHVSPVYHYDDIHEYKQSDLDSDSVFILNTGDDIYVWVGAETDDHFKANIDQFAKGYIRLRGKNEGTTHVIKQGREPARFKEAFEQWDTELWEKMAYENERDRVLRTNEINTY